MVSLVFIRWSYKKNYSMGFSHITWLYKRSMNSVVTMGILNLLAPHEMLALPSKCEPNSFSLFLSPSLPLSLSLLSSSHPPPHRFDKVFTQTPPQIHCINIHMYVFSLPVNELHGNDGDSPLLGHLALVGVLSLLLIVDHQVGGLGRGVGGGRGGGGGWEGRGGWGGRGGGKEKKK